MNCMSEYSPFLKLKRGELSALRYLSFEDRRKIIPLLEPQRNDKYTDEKLVKTIDRGIKYFKKYIEHNFFYIDNYEIPDELKLNNKDSYYYLLDIFSDYDMIPVIGLDRSKSHNDAGLKYANYNTGKIAFRITQEYINSFLAYAEDFDSMINKLDSKVSCTVLIDCRYVDDKAIEIIEKNIVDMLEKIRKNKKINKFVIFGSSIPEIISEKVKANTNAYIYRSEVDLFNKIKYIYSNENILFGDYTVLSPDFPEIKNLPPELYINVMTSKIIYSQLDSHYFTRGKKIKQHGFEQYIEQAKDIIKQPFYRGNNNSWGDNFLYEKVNYGGKNITPSSIIGPTVNAHMKFMIDEVTKGSL